MTHPDETPNRLLPCPFCGSLPHITENHHFRWVTCDKCDINYGLQQKDDLNKSTLTAEEIWNTRSALSAQPADALPDHFHDITKMVLPNVTVDMMNAGAEVLNKYVGKSPADTYHGTAGWAFECFEAMIAACRGAEVVG